MTTNAARTCALRCAVALGVAACGGGDDKPAASAADASAIRGEGGNMSGPDQGSSAGGNGDRPGTKTDAGSPRRSDGGSATPATDAATLDPGAPAQPAQDSGAQPTTDAGRESSPDAGEPPIVDAGPVPCMPACAGKVCGDDGCGGSCGHCDDHFSCSASGDRCSCQPQCAGRSCGSDSCGGSCGPCDSPMVCDTQAGSCAATCTANCTNRLCGDDGCDGSCGPCGDGESCDATGRCVCTGHCEGRACGDDGCGRSCGPCTSAQHCTAAGQCECTPDCTNRECGSDGCSGTCGSGCSAGNRCTTAGTCRVPTFAADVYPIFTRSSVGCPGCHRAVTNPPGKLNLSSASTAFGNLVNADASQCTPIRKRVTPGQPSMSYLVNKLAGTMMCGTGVRMPKNRAALGTADMDTIRAWITGGAMP